MRIHRELRSNCGRDTGARGADMSTGIEAQVLQPYKYGFVTDIEADVVPPGLSEDVIRLISAKKGEPEWMLEWRLKAYRNWLKMPEPHWSNVTYGPIDRSEEHTSELQSLAYLVCRLLLEKKKKKH